MLMPLLGSQVSVCLFNDDWRAGRTILRARDFNKETAPGGEWHEGDFAILTVYVFSPRL